MCAMNEVNGSASCEDKSLLMGALKTDLGFPGFVFPDTMAQKTAYGSISGGLDYGSSNTWSTSTIKAFLSNGSLTEARLDDMVIRNVIGYYKANLDNGEQPAKAGVCLLRWRMRKHMLIRYSMTTMSTPCLITLRSFGQTEPNQLSFLKTLVVFLCASLEG